MVGGFGGWGDGRMLLPLSLGVLGLGSALGVWFRDGVLFFDQVSSEWWWLRAGMRFNGLLWGIQLEDLARPWWNCFPWFFFRLLRSCFTFGMEFCFPLF